MVARARPIDSAVLLADQMAEGVRAYQAAHIARYSTEYLAGIDLFNAREFHAAHDVWEERWRDDAGPEEKLFLQGLIQIAVVFHYLELGRIGAARNMFGRANEKFERFGRSPYMSLDVTRLRAEVREALGWLFEGTAESVRIPEPFAAPMIRLETKDQNPTGS